MSSTVDLRLCISWENMQNNRISEIADTLGLDRSMDQENYVRTMRKRFGRKAERFMETVDELQASGEAMNPVKIARAYRLKNRDWKMSTLVSQRSDGRMHMRLLQWIAGSELDVPSNACEVGCDVGLFACALASYWETSCVVGLDRLREAVDAARVHSVQKGIDNVEFRKVDVHEPLSDDLKSGFDLVVCPWVIQELVPSARKGIGISDGERGTLKNLVELLEPGGKLLTVDRLPYGLEQQAPIVEALVSSGVELVVRDSLVVEHHGKTESFPLALLRDCREIPC